METRFTPGPWKWWTSNSWNRLKRDDRGITQNVLEPFVARDGHPDCSVSEADMALIATAPAMYEALDSIMPVLERAMHVLHGADLADAQAEYARARAALRAARGEQGEG
jgi:hypothetical protein